MGRDPQGSRSVRELPLLALRGMAVFPHMVVHLEVGREKSMNAIDEAMLGDRRILLASQKDTRVDHPEPGDIYPVGTIAEIKQLIRLSGGTIRVLVEGLGRARVLEYTRLEPYFRATLEEAADAAARTPEVDALMRAVNEEFEQYAKMSRRVSSETVVTVAGVEDPGRLGDTIATHLTLKADDKQRLLEAFDVKERLETVLEFLSREVEILDLERKINVRVKKQMERSQKEYYLREQLKAIHKELGDKEDRSSEVEELRERVKSQNLPAEVADKAMKEIDRLEKMPPMAAEAVVVRNYLDWILGLPWGVETEDRLDLAAVEDVLEADHYGLTKPKERILEFLAIRKLADKMKSPILCLIGPPGVGKTSLAKSVARAMERKFVRISLGGVRDEAEIRGHRRTYVGALPGRIIQGMRQAGARNPVFLMDEIDKMSSDFRGDPASALLEVLDPEQNHSFSDHYIELAFDLSKVLFITTANTAYSIPRALLDRMEVIQIAGYTEEEKVEIARRHLMSKLLGEHGLKPEHLSVSEGAIRHIIRKYTREAGVRHLERELAGICRKTAREVVGGRTQPVRVTAQNLHVYLGTPRFRFGVAEEKDQVGIATGLVVTDVGGDTLPIEVTVMKGKGGLLLTGKLGEVMKESAQAGFSYIRARVEGLGIAPDFHEQVDLHIHVPEGAIPKEGPSAGITMATAVISALAGRPVRRDVAMTGEITLRGRILAVGGVKEKVLAAHRAGINIVVLPEENRKDVDEVPANVRKRIQFIFVEHMDEVLEHALANRGGERDDAKVLPEGHKPALPEPRDEVQIQVQ